MGSDAKLQKTIKWLSSLSLLEAILAFYSLFQIPSETGSAVLFGLSRSRLFLVAVDLLIILLLGILTISFFCSRFSVIRKFVLDALSNQKISFLLFCLCEAIVIGGLLFVILRFSPIQSYDNTVSVIFSRAKGLIVLLIMLGCQTAALIFFSRKSKTFSSLQHIAVFFSIGMAAFYLFADYYDQVDWNLRLDGLGITILLPVIFALCGSVAHVLMHKYPISAKLDTIFLCLFIGTFSYAIFHLTGQCMGRWNTPAKAYWHLLAEAFLDGRLYLIDPPTTHDLTMFAGKWYVPNPPMPAILLMPVVWLFKDTEAVNMTVVSAIIAAINVMLIYLVLRRASDQRMTRCEIAANLWLTAVFAIGTNHYWLATIGQMWFVSQLLTVMFCALAVLTVISGRPGWVTGFSLGFCMLCRPNIFPMVFLLAGIWLWKNSTFPQIPCKRFLCWGMTVAIPALSCTALLLWYNDLRFSDWLDFGYVTINGADWIKEAVQTYGMFNLKFVPSNAQIMFLRAPQFDFSGDVFFFQPGIAGFSIFIMTPPLFYVFRRFQKNWWVIGAWLTTILTVVLLLCYHNSGAEQVGFRYMMDFILPVMLLMAIGVGEKPSWLFKFLTFCALVINFLSIYWWYIARV